MTSFVNGGGFQIEDHPVVGASRVAARAAEPIVRPVANDRDLLYVVARDPTSLFLYWDINWTRLFSRAGLSARQVHLRIFRMGGAIEGTQEINPFRGHCYVGVSSPGSAYFCELGSFDGAEWISLIRSGRAIMPEGSVSEDLSAEFATLPIHLSFQRLLETFGEHEIDPAMLARSVAELQAEARALRTKMALGDYSEVATRIATRLNGTSKRNGAQIAELSSLVEAALRNEVPATPGADELARWEKLREELGGSSWSNASHGGFGGTSGSA